MRRPTFWYRHSPTAFAGTRRQSWQDFAYHSVTRPPAPTAPGGQRPPPRSSSARTSSRSFPLACGGVYHATLFFVKPRRKEILDIAQIGDYNKGMAYTEQQLAVRRERAKAWNAANKDRVRRNQRLWVLRNSEMVRRAKRDYAKAHRDENRARRIAWCAARPWYDSWQSARQRCTNPGNPAYGRYGGRGIAFSLSKADMMFLWARDHAESMRQPTIDRRDNDGPYALENCRIIEKSDNSKKSFVDRMLAKR